MTLGEKGAALILAIMSLALLAAFGFSLSMMTNIDRRAAANAVSAQEGLHAAEAALEFAQAELQGMPDWTVVTAGSVQSMFTAGAPEAQTLNDGTSVDLVQITSALDESDWRLFAFGRARLLGALPSDACIAVWVRPDPSQPGGLSLRADAFAAGGTRRSVAASLRPTGPQSWKEIR